MYLPGVGDHPRMRGEHALRMAARLAKRGSSPHARGARQCRSLKRGVLGIIPACAGSTHLHMTNRDIQ